MVLLAYVCADYIDGDVSKPCNKDYHIRLSYNYCDLPLHHMSKDYAHETTHNHLLHFLFYHINQVYPGRYEICL